MYVRACLRTTLSVEETFDCFGLEGELGEVMKTKPRETAKKPSSQSLVRGDSRLVGQDSRRLTTD